MYRWSLWCLIFILFLHGCGFTINDVINKKDKPYDVATSDLRFQPYVYKFEKDFQLKVEVPIVFNKMDENYSGICFVWSDGYKEININKKHWDTYTEEQREQLIYHELGHCVANLKHKNGMFDKCPKSIMRSYMFNLFETNNCYIPNREYYVNEFVKDSDD